MMDEQRKKKMLKIVITILAILLAISVAVLAGMLIYRHFAPAGPSTVIVPDNIITPDADAGEGAQTGPTGTEESTEPPKAEEEADQTLPSEQPEESTGAVQPPAANPTVDETDETATAIYLYDRNPGDNKAFHSANMFPGDVETGYFCVQVSYKDTVTVKYRADIRPGYEKLAEVLKCKIVLLTTGQTLYDGLMADMPKSLDHTLRSASETTAELYYEITAYLDTSVGNEYQNKELIADFHWWVEEEDHLVEPPYTGDNSNLTLWFVLMIGSLFLLILLLAARKKEERNANY